MDCQVVALIDRGLEWRFVVLMSMPRDGGVDEKKRGCSLSRMDESRITKWAWSSSTNNGLVGTVTVEPARTDRHVRQGTGIDSGNAMGWGRASKWR
jgi:hypothetical protein